MNSFRLTLRLFIIIFRVETSLIAFSCLLFFHFAFQIRDSTDGSCRICCKKFDKRRFSTYSTYFYEFHRSNVNLQRIYIVICVLSS